jgi:hypothetical protein
MRLQERDTAHVASITLCGAAAGPSAAGAPVGVQPQSQASLMRQLVQQAADGQPLGQGGAGVLSGLVAAVARSTLSAAQPVPSPRGGMAAGAAPAASRSGTQAVPSREPLGQEGAGPGPSTGPAGLFGMGAMEAAALVVQRLGALEGRVASMESKLDRLLDLVGGLQHGPAPGACVGQAVGG